MHPLGWIERDGAVEIPLRVRPGAPADAVGGRRGDAVKVAVTAPAADGRANDAVCRLIARRLGVPPSAVALVSGARARDKRVRVQGCTLAAAQAALPA